MERVGDFYARLPRGPAPEIKPTGLIGRYQARYFGKNPSKMRKSTLRFIRFGQPTSRRILVNCPSVNVC